MNQLELLKKFRRKLHSIAELSGYEKRTAMTIKQYLLKLEPSLIIENLGGEGLLIEFDSGNKGATVLFRAELDALPIQEVHAFPHKSENDGVSHKCGHDGHSTILIGLVEKIISEKSFKGKLQLLFQPAEETGEGARKVLNDSKFSGVNPDFVFALHNIPNQPKGEIITKAGSFNASVVSLVVKFFGTTSHAAEPENGINPDRAISNLILQIKEMANLDYDSEDFMKVATVYSRIGAEDYGISAGEGEVHFTIRCWTEEKLEIAKKKIEDLVSELASNEKLTYSIDWIFAFTASNNDNEAAEIINKAADKNGFSIQHKKYPFTWGEDFGAITQKYKGAMFGLGAGLNMPALHNQDYDFPDDIIPFGVEMFYEIFQMVQEKYS